MSDLPAFIGRYRVVEQLGRGGMGVLYLARDPAIGRTVAIKVACVHDVELRERFLREARATGCLNHRNIVTVFDVGEHDGEPFIAMEYVAGRTLAEIVHRKTPLPLPERLRIMRELCDGLAHAHGEGIIHRDVKPANLIVRGDSGSLTILDFGIARMAAKQTTTAAAGGLTGTGAVIGTPNYMAPEQIDGGVVDQRCDVFAAGLVFYELLSYRRAFSADSPSAVIYKIVHEAPPRLTELMPDLDSGLVGIVERMVAKKADDRYQHLSEAIGDLDDAVERIDPGEGSPESTIALGDNRSSDPSSAGGGVRTDGAALVARREARMTEHLAAASAALESQRCDAAQAAAEQAGLIDPDDDRVVRMLDRIAAARLAQKVEEHLSHARGHLADLALTRATDSVELALQAQPKCPAALQLRDQIEARRSVNRWLDKAEQRLATGEFRDALDAVHEALALDPGHEAALTLKDRIDAAARDSRVRTRVEEARSERAAGDLAAAQAMLEGLDETHELVVGELAGIRSEIVERRESFEALVAQARGHVEHGDLQGAREPLRQALDAIGAAGPALPPDASRLTDTGPRTVGEPDPPVPPEETVVFDAGGDRPLGQRSATRLRMLVAVLGVVAVVVTIAVAGEMWPVVMGPDRQESRPAGTQDAVTGDGGARTSPTRTPASSTGASDVDSADESARADPIRPAGLRASGSSATAALARPARARASPGSSSPPFPATPTGPSGPDIVELLAAAVSAEAAGDVDGALERYASVLRRDTDNPTALAGRDRIRVEKIRIAVQVNLRAANAAFAAGRYDDARRLFQDASDLSASPAAAEGLRRVDNAEALFCRDGATCGTLVVRVTPAAEIFVDERSLGVAAGLELPMAAGRHDLRLETTEWRFPRVMEVAAGAVAEIEVDLQQDGFPK